MKYTIKQFSEMTNLSPHTLRYYENEGLIPFVERNKNGIRKFSDEDLEWIGLICCLKGTGMSIKQIKKFVQLSIEGEETLEERCKMLIEHKKKVIEEIKTMEKHLKKVSHKIEYYSNQLNKNYVAK